MHRLHKRCLQAEHHIRRQIGKAQCVGAFVDSLSYQIGFRAGGRNKNVGVVVRSTNQQVVASRTNQLIVPGTTNQSIVQTITEQRIRTSTANDVLQDRRGIELQRAIGMHRLNRSRPKINHNVCGQIGKAQRIDTFIQSLGHPIGFRAGGRNKNVGVVVRPTNQPVIASRTNQLIVPGSASQSIVQTVAKQHVSTITADSIFYGNVRAQNEAQVRGVH